MYSDQQKNAGMIDIFTPDKNDLDNALVELGVVSRQYLEMYREEKELELFFQKATDAIVNDKDDTGKKLYTYPVNARSKIDEENREKADRLVEVWIKKKEYEVMMGLAGDIYRHVRDSIKSNQMIDRQAEIVWGML